MYAVLAIAYIVGMPLVRYRMHRWESTDTAVYTQTGWLSRERRIAPMSRVQTVDFEQSPLSRLLGLASVTVTTASAAGPAAIEGIDKPVADRLVEDLPDARRGRDRGRHVSDPAAEAPLADADPGADPDTEPDCRPGGRPGGRAGPGPGPAPPVSTVPVAAARPAGCCSCTRSRS